MEIINLAENNGLSILTFPPHCSHRLQPLDVAVFGPFKTFYNSFADAWMTNHPGRSITIYEISELSGAAFVKAFTLENITSAFKATGIYPFSPQIFTEDSFLPSAVTERPCCSSTPVELVKNNSISTDDENILLRIHPHPKIFSTKPRRPTKQQKSAIITNQTEKIRHSPQVSIEVQSSSKDDDTLAESSCNNENSVYENNNKMIHRPIISSSIPLKSFVILKVYSHAKKFKNFIAQIISGPDIDGDYEIKFLKKSFQIKNSFVFPEKDDLASASHDDIICVLEPPLPAASTSRLSNVLKFKENLFEFDLC